MKRGTFTMAATALLLLAVALFAAGCATWHGFGEDVERGGEKIQGK